MSDFVENKLLSSPESINQSTNQSINQSIKCENIGVIGMEKEINPIKLDFSGFRLKKELIININ